MRERFIEKVLRLACLVLLGLIAFEVSHMLTRRDSLAHLAIPPLPALAGGTNAPAESMEARPKTTKEGVVAAASATNTATVKTADTNAPIAAAGSSNAPVVRATVSAATNSPPPSNSIALATNSAMASSNKLAAASTGQTNTSASPTTTHVVTIAPTNIVATNVAADTAENRGTNSPPGRRASKKNARVAGLNAGGIPPQPGVAAAGPLPDLAPPIQARIDKILLSEVLGQIVHPVPMALLGIAGKDVFLRTPAGQMGMVKEGDELGGVKVLRIGINRVLVEEGGKQQELTLFAGFGGQSLLTETNSPPR